MKKAIKAISSSILLAMLSLGTVRADLVSPAQTLTIPISAIVVVAVIAIIAWLIIKKIKKKNAPKSTK